MGNLETFPGRRTSVIGFLNDDRSRRGAGFRAPGRGARGASGSDRIGMENNADTAEGSGRDIPVRCPMDAHEIVVGPTGSGKTVTRIIPQIIEHDGPVVALDVKGELYHTTALSRAVRGHELILIDPFGLVPEMDTSRLDPGQAIMASDDPDDQALILAEALNPETLQAREPFWDLSANRLNAAGLLYVATHNLRMMYDRGVPSSWQDILNCDNVALQIANILDEEDDLPRLVHQTFAGYMQMPEATRGSIAAVAQTAMRLFGQRAVRRVTNGSDVDLAQLAERDDYAIYIAIPPRAIAAYGALLRLWFEMILKALMERRSIPERPTMVVVDEAGAVGRIPSLETAFSMGRAYGIKAVAAVQTLHQLEDAYDKAHRVLTDNAGLISVLQPPHYLAAREVADLIGTFSPEQLLGLGTDEFMAARRGHRPRILRRRNYLEEPELQVLATRNPRHSGRPL